jgi:hypothetical protein
MFNRLLKYLKKHRSVKKEVDVYRSRIVIVHEPEVSDYNCIVQMYNIIKLYKMT